MRAHVFSGLSIVVSLLVVACGSGSDNRPPDIDRDASTTPDAPGGVTDAALPDIDAASPDAGSTTDAGTAQSIATCSTIAVTGTMQLVPAAIVQYTRCETRGPEAGARALLSGDGSRLALLTTAGTVRLFATNPWDEITQIAAPVGIIDAIAFSPDGSTLATLAAEVGTVTLWSSVNGERGATFPGPAASLVDTWVSSLAFSADGQRLATSLGTVIALPDGKAVATFTGRAVLQLKFSPDGARLFVDSPYRIGNSPPSRRLFIKDLASGSERELFAMYDRALRGVAVSTDGAYVALGVDEEGEVGGFARGLHVYAVASDAAPVSDGAFTGVVLGMSSDAKFVFTIEGGMATVRDRADLHVVRQLAWPATATFVGVAPGDELVAVDNGVTQWRSTTTGAVTQTLARPITQASWLADGTHGVGVGAPGAAFVVWRESGAASLCAPPTWGGEAPTLASLGTQPDANGDAVSADGTTALSRVFVIHTHATDYTSVHVTDVASGQLLRAFGASTGRPISMAEPDAAKLFTLEGGAVAVWCR